MKQPVYLFLLLASALGQQGLLGLPPSLGSGQEAVVLVLCVRLAVLRHGGAADGRHQTVVHEFAPEGRVYLTFIKEGFT